MSTSSSAPRAWRLRPARAALGRIRRRRSVVLGYHGVARSRLRDDLSLLQVSPDRFRRQLELLLSAGFDFVTLADLARRAAGGAPDPGLAAVTFDDGMRNNHTTALPILREYGIPATVYVTIGFIGGRSPWIGPGGDGAIMDEPELRDLAGAGWELGAHTMTHADLSTLGYEACLREIEDSRTELERIGGVEVETFAYPFGRYGPAALAAARDADVIAAVTTGSGSWEPYEMTRAMIGARDPLPVVLLKLTDRYEPLLQSPPARLARRGSKRLRGALSSRRGGEASAT
ncbi:MAG TPA: polysaccharide deacetylase family protein [Solirubrobacteraceae bacterium]|jgi:peptidoglycan/xylan/chitin deacetylase (PgdA/CDA1 family)